MICRGTMFLSNRIKKYVLGLYLLGMIMPAHAGWFDSVSSTWSSITAAVSARVAQITPGFIRTGFNQAQEAVARQVQDHPLPSLGIASALGAFTAWFGRGSRDKQEMPQNNHHAHEQEGAGGQVIDAGAEVKVDLDKNAEDWEEHVALLCRAEQAEKEAKDEKERAQGAEAAVRKFQDNLWQEQNAASKREADKKGLERKLEKERDARIQAESKAENAKREAAQANRLLLDIDTELEEKQRGKAAAEHKMEVERALHKDIENILNDENSKLFIIQQETQKKLEEEQRGKAAAEQQLAQLQQEQLVEQERLQAVVDKSKKERLQDGSNLEERLKTAERTREEVQKRLAELRESLGVPGEEQGEGSATDKQQPPQSQPEGKGKEKEGQDGVQEEGEAPVGGSDHKKESPEGMGIAKETVDLNEVNLILNSLELQVEEGKELYKNITGENREAYTAALNEKQYFGQVVVFLKWLHAIAEVKGQQFEEGTFMIDDPDNHVYAFLSGCPGAYDRRSSHLVDYFKLEDSSRAGYMKGIDVVGKATWTNPFGHSELSEREGYKRHLLFCDVGGRLFVKPENWGTSVWDAIPHGLEFIVAQARKTPALQPYVGTDDDEGYRKERIPGDILKRYLAILDSNREKSIKRAKAFGIQEIVRQLIALKKLDRESSPAGELLRDIKGKYPDLGVFGNEVSIRLKDLKEGLGQVSPLLPLSPHSAPGSPSSPLALDHRVSKSGD